MSLAPDATNAPQVARRLTEELGADADAAHDVARVLDRLVFDLDHHPTDAERADVTRALDHLQSLRGRTPVAAGRRATST